MAKSEKISKRMQRRAEERRKKRKQMLAITGIVLVVLLAAAAFAIFGGNTKQSNQPNSTNALPLEIEVQQAYQMVKDGAFLLDVRTQAEWDEYHAPQAVLIPLDKLPDRLEEIPRKGDIVVICNSGNRSQVGRDILLDAGFERVTSSAGGIQAWAAAGYPTE